MMKLTASADSAFFGATMKKMLGVAAVFLTSLGTPLAWAGYEEGLAAARHGDYVTALREFRQLADQGDASAQYALGVMHMEGRGVSQDNSEAVRWFWKSAVQGNGEAEYNLGFMHYHGLGVRQGYAEAAKWFMKAAEHGYIDARYNLGIMYQNGQGVRQSYVHAVRWYRMAAEQNGTAAQIDLGMMYYKGQGVPRDYVQAYMWAIVAISNSPPGQYRKLAAKNRDIIATGMSPVQIEEAQRLAREWSKKQKRN